VDLAAVFFAAAFFAGVLADAPAAAAAAFLVVVALAAFFAAGLVSVFDSPLAAADLVAAVLAAGLAAVFVAAAFFAGAGADLAAGLLAVLAVVFFAAAFLVLAVVLVRVLVAATAREAVAGSRVTWMPCSSSARSTTFIRLGAICASSSATRSCSASTEPWVRPCLSRVCRAGRENSWGRDGAGLAAFLDTGDTDYLSSLTRGTACAITGTPGDANDNNAEGGSIAAVVGAGAPIDLDLDIVKRVRPRSRIGTGQRPVPDHR